MKINKILMIMFVMLTAISCSFASDENEIYSVLEAYHNASLDGDVDAYMDTLEIEYYEFIMPEDQDYRDFVEGTFSAVDVVSYEITDYTVRVHNDDTALVFYNIESEIEEIGGSGAESLNNDMVAFFVKVDGDWKLRWNILHSLYEFKLGADVINDYMAWSLIDDFAEEGETLKDIAIDDGILVIEDIDLSVDDYDEDEMVDSYTPSSSYGTSSSSSSSSGSSSSGFSSDDYEDYYNKHYGDLDDDDGSLWWLWFILIVIVLIWFFKPSKKDKEAGKKYSQEVEKIKAEEKQKANKEKHEHKSDEKRDLKKEFEDKVAAKKKKKGKKSGDLNKDQQYDYTQEMGADGDVSNDVGGGDKD